MRGKSSNNQSERIEKSGSLCTFQDRRSVSVETNATVRGLSLKRHMISSFIVKIIRIISDSNGKTYYANLYLSTNTFYKINIIY